MNRLVAGAFLALGVLAAPAAHAQQPPNMPSREEILAKIQEAMPKLLERSPEESLEVAGVCKLTYKQIPTEPSKIAEALGEDLGGRQLPPGQKIDQYIGMFKNEITEALNEIMSNVGTFEALQPIKVKSKTIPVGEHRIGLVFEGEKPVGIRIFNEDPEKLEKPIDIRLKTKSIDAQESLALQIKEPKKQKEGAESFEIRVACLRFLAKTGKLKVADE